MAYDKFGCVVDNCIQTARSFIFFITLQVLMTKNKRRNWRRLLAGGLIAIVVLALVITAAILLTGSPNFPGSQAKTAASITLEEWLEGSLSTKSFNGTWLSGKYLSGIPYVHIFDIF